MKHCVVPKQHPPAHDDTVHWQVADAPEPTHWRPAAQGPPVEPHTHAPRPASQRLVPADAVQSAHAAPGAPHAVSASAVHVEPAQQPDGQRVALQPEHTPAEHVPPPQLRQVAPPVPHAFGSPGPAR